MSKDNLMPSTDRDTVKTVEDLVQALGDLCHEKYMGCNKARNTGVTDKDWDYCYTDEVVNMLDTPEAKALIAELITQKEKEADQAARIDELKHITVYVVGDEIGAWYEPNEGYQQTVDSRIKELQSPDREEDKR